MRGENYLRKENIMDTNELIFNTLDSIPHSAPDAKQIVALVKKGGKIAGYKLSDNSTIEKAEAVKMAKSGQIAGVAVAHRGSTEYLKAIPDGSENNNLGNLPSVSPEN